MSGESAVYHVMSRTAFRQFAFKDKEKEVFCSLLRSQADFSGVEVLAFCVMGNHFHLLLRVPTINTLPDAELIRRYTNYYRNNSNPKSVLTADELKTILVTGGRTAELARNRIISRIGDLSSFMRELKQRFTIWYNHHHDNFGTIWSARYKSILVEDTPEVLTKVAAYIDLNPIRAGLAMDPAEYRWCSYAQCMAGLGLQRAGMIRLFHSKANYNQCIQSYRLILFGKGYSGKIQPGKHLGRIPAERLNKILDSGGAVPIEEVLRSRIRYLSDGVVLGSAGFLERQFKDHSELFTRRKSPGYTIPGTCWEGLCSMRSFKNRAYS